MRLLNIHTLELEDFTGREVPPYCILSHRWGEDEVSYKEFRKGSKTDGVGYRKILGFCEFVKGRRWRPYSTESANGSSSPLYSDSTDWVWIDTCTSERAPSDKLICQMLNNNANGGRLYR
jgi:hypothetical protein